MPEDTVTAAPKPLFVDNARLFLKKYSTWFFAAIAALAAAEPYLGVVQTLLPGNVYNWVLAAVSLAGILATQLRQASVAVPPSAATQSAIAAAIRAKALFPHYQPEEEDDGK